VALGVSLEELVRGIHGKYDDLMRQTRRLKTAQPAEEVAIDVPAIEARVRESVQAENAQVLGAIAAHASDIIKLGGEVEADESYIGGRARFMHKHRRDQVQRGRGASKVAVMGLLQRTSADRKSKVRLQVVKSIKRPFIQSEVRKNVEAGSTLYTDQLQSYAGLDRDYVHGVIDHAEAYVDGQVHTNGMENFWSLLKRTIKGTYVSVEPFHLFRYLDEQAYRFNERGGNDGDRFELALKSIVGKRIMFKDLTGHQGVA
jgi:transposase-like protein